MRGRGCKAALVVRFITRRFIGEYDPNLEKVYSFQTEIDNEIVHFEILDSAGEPHGIDQLTFRDEAPPKTTVYHWFSDFNRGQSMLTDEFKEGRPKSVVENEYGNLESNIRWAEAFILMYSVTDKCSFDECHRLKFLINYNKRRRRLASADWVLEVPVVLVGNKTDQYGDRMVSTEEGQRRSKEIGCVCFHEISVRESIDQKIIFEILQNLPSETNSTLQEVECSPFDYRK
ncbi:Ras-related and estrogen-regulated growth inhibitor [Eumeta japonica]|uniref:small monomeric GTPase n=1 Tax=Eumeta variegata TaxID=151549 RepID=A0A4C1YKW1_EUMVA|nr:Ras-related and estrogen-regulated growth inhibitor [Eumeta japonica]